MVCPGLFDGKRSTIATTPSPNRMSTKVPRNSAINSAVSVGFGFIDLLWQKCCNREVVYQGRERQAFNRRARRESAKNAEQILRIFSPFGYLPLHFSSLRLG